MTVFVTNIWNHYTTNIGFRLAGILGEENFRMILTAPVQDSPDFKERREMGWKFDLPKERWLVSNPQFARDLRGSEHVRLIEDADVAVIGALYGTRPLFRAVRRRARSGKLTLFTNERYFKNYPSLWDSFKPMNLARWYRRHRLMSRPNVHYLPISHWGAEDARFYDGCHGRVWKWAYTPEVSDEPTEKAHDGIMRIGWCGRMLPWKHVEHMVEAMALLPAEYRARCRMTLVGEGPCREGLARLVEDRGLRNGVEFLPYMPVAEVTRLMGELDVYILPSDRGEGWGVVLAEAMDRCCVPIACVEAGATLDLIDDAENGFVFEKGDCRRVAKKLMWLIDHPAERREMGLKAWETMQRRSPDEAARRLCTLIKAIQTGDKSLVPDEGLCSAVNL